MVSGPGVIDFLDIIDIFAIKQEELTMANRKKLSDFFCKTDPHRNRCEGMQSPHCVVACRNGLGLLILPQIALQCVFASFFSHRF